VCGKRAFDVATKAQRARALLEENQNRKGRAAAELERADPRRQTRSHQSSRRMEVATDERAAAELEGDQRSARGTDEVGHAAGNNAVPHRAGAHEADRPRTRVRRCTRALRRVLVMIARQRHRQVRQHEIRGGKRDETRGVVAGSRTKQEISRAVAHDDPDARVDRDHAHRG